jgi:hypothetical protein
VALGGTTGVSNGLPSSMPDGWTGTAAAISTFGDHADGIVAQSIGGGGGNAGMGSGNTQGFGQTSSSSISLNLGAKGGTGGAGGAVNVNLYSGSIQTYGSDAIGVLAQSVGGGGGSSQGGSLNIAQSFGVKKATIEPDLNFRMGGNGVTGADGGTVAVNVSAPIATAGGDATGLLAQSIGGGGGVGGSAGADGSADNPVITALKAREFGSELSALLTKELNLPNSGSLPPLDVTFGVAIGGTGGAGGDGQTVTINQNAPIATSGDWAAGMIAQSIGGGGGKGGSSAASGTGGFDAITINLDYSLGGSGGTGGDGGPVNITMGDGAAVSTQGFGAAGVVAQSVGGGGGIAADGSDSSAGTISLGATTTGNGGGGGDGGTVTFLYNGSNPTISTLGDVADGIVLQSIGGGGGIAGAGSSKWVQSLGIAGQPDQHAADHLDQRLELIRHSCAERGRRGRHHRHAAYRGRAHHLDRRQQYRQRRRGQRNHDQFDHYQYFRCRLFRHLRAVGGQRRRHHTRGGLQHRRSHAGPGSRPAADGADEAGQR